MKNSPKLKPSLPKSFRNTQPLSFREVLQLRDGIEIQRNENFRVCHLSSPDIFKIFNYPNSLN
ncbi:MAG: hypothetical protein CMH75_05785 [Nitrospina sp.]|nr:hypothetical protein [Nitrospina sp.]